MFENVKLSLSFASVRYLWTRILLAIQNGLIEKEEGYELIEEILKEIPNISEKENIFSLDKEMVTIAIREELLLAILTVSSFEDVDINRNMVGAELIFEAKKVLTIKDKNYTEENEMKRLKRLFEGGGEV